MSDLVERLLPCPFCGSEAKYSWLSGSTRHFIKCEKCGCKSAIFVAGHGGSAKDAWNTRTNTAEIASLRSQLDDARRADEWQDISTAPISNGSNRFLAYIIGHGSCVCYACAGGFIYNMEGKRVYSATHWRPLPEPPAAIRRLSEQEE